MKDSITQQFPRVPIKDVAIINPRRFDIPISDDESLSFVPMKDVEEETGRLHTKVVKSWKEVKKGYTPFQEGDVIFAKITPCMENGKFALAMGLHGGRAAGSTEFHVFRPKPIVDPKYLLYYFFTPAIRHAAKANMKGTAGQLRVPIAFLEEQEIPLPSIEDQRSIVSEIEKQFTRLDAGVAALKRLQANLKRYRASVLKAACEGKLVPTEAELARKEGREYEPASVLLERILKERREKWQAQYPKKKYVEPKGPDTSNLPELPEGWCWATIDAIAFVTKLAGFEYTKYVKYDSAGDMAVIKAENAGKNGYKVTDYSRIKSNTIVHLNRSKLKAGDLLMVFVGAGTGNVAKVPEDQDYFLGPNISMIRVKSEFVLPAYLEYFLRSPNGNYLALKNSKAVAQPSLSMATIRMIPCAIPPINEQKRIYEEIGRRLSITDENSTIIEMNIKRMERLRQAVLQRIFEGVLA